MKEKYWIILAFITSTIISFTVVFFIVRFLFNLISESREFLCR